MITSHLQTKNALKGDVVLVHDAHFSLTPLSENDESKKLVVKGTCCLEHDIFLVSNDIFVKETPLEEPCDVEVVEVIPYDLEVMDPIYIE